MGSEFQGSSSKSWLQGKKKSSKAETLYRRKDLCCHGEQAFLFPVDIYQLQDEPGPLLATASLSAIRQLLLSQFRPPTEDCPPTRLSDFILGLEFILVGLQIIKPSS